MCGIVGYVGKRPARELLLNGLKRLEYRGYDSAGISVIAEDRIEAVRAVGNLAALEAKLGESDRAAEAQGSSVALLTRPPTTGIGHTRWATHGRVSEENAHPHYDSADRIHVVVNGIVENYMALKERLAAQGGVFTSETDAEVIAHLVSYHYSGDLAAAVRAAYAEMEGHYAFVAMSLDEPDTLVAARKECPLVVGRGEGEQFVASDVPAFLAETRTVQYIESGEIVILRPEGVTISTAAGVELERPTHTVDWDSETAEKGGFETFMLKEIHEQADAVAETIADRTARGDGVDLDDEGALDEAILADVKRIVIVACGTSYHAGLIGRYAIEEWARVPVEMDVASEYRYRNPVVGPGDLVIGISQSGETADTLAALRKARERGATVLAITNVMGSQITRDSDGVLFTRAGLEIGVAATKTFVCQVAVIYLLGLRLAELRGTLPPERLAELVSEVKRLPSAIAEVTGIPSGPDGGAAGSEAGAGGGVAAQIARIADEHWRKEFFLYIGRHVGLPVALEGALKLKEISYIATDAYAAGEMKHGPIALLDESTPVVCVATDSPVLEKLASNMQEVRARGAHVIALTSAGNEQIVKHADAAVEVPAIDWMLQPILAVIPLQMLAYEIARRRGLNVDQPRNLAKTVTVE
ncbi:MAG TPA: glutamine--fructose-6-phosphate transaminase (isomerizing) [Solirubrobacteraceae bacterium]